VHEERHRLGSFGSAYEFGSRLVGSLDRRYVGKRPKWRGGNGEGDGTGQVSFSRLSPRPPLPLSPPAHTHTQTHITALSPPFVLCTALNLIV
jgi:hypothetical protein